MGRVRRERIEKGSKERIEIPQGTAFLLSSEFRFCSKAVKYHIRCNYSATTIEVLPSIGT